MILRGRWDLYLALLPHIILIVSIGQGCQFEWQNVLK